MAAKVNIVLDDDVKAEMERLVASGQRSRLINAALRKELLSMRRTSLSQELDRARKKTRAVSSREIVDALRRDRRRR